MIVICDSSPIIALAICNQLDLLDQLFNEVIIPKHVYKELTLPGKLETKKIMAWAESKMIEVKNKNLMNVFNTILDAGESEAMALYWEKEADILLIDEKKGRKIASYNGMKIIGTLGILLLSKQKGLLTAVKPLLDLLQQTNIRISDNLYQKTLELASEK
jgi:predicted nucleic acid-binding protein